MYYALFDLQTKDYLATGLNSKNLTELLNAYRDYKSIDVDDEQGWREHFNKLSLPEKISFVEFDEFVIEKQKEKFEERW